jgi:hypothetical protein
MEKLFLLLVIVSSALGLLLRGQVNRRLSRFLLGIDLAAFGLGIATFGASYLGLVSMWTMAGGMLVLFLLAGITLPFGIVTACWHSWDPPQSVRK